MSNPDKPSYVLLGGAGFLGRSMVQHLVNNNLASHIRVADKKKPMLCYMSADVSEMFEQKVDFVHADLTKEDHVKMVFDRQFTFVINFCGETRMCMPACEYVSKCVEPATLCSTAALAMSPPPRLFVQMSSAHVYEPHSKPATESSKIKPWTVLSSAALTAEERVLDAAERGLPVCILRPAIVYGPADVTGLAPRLCVAATYEETGETMKLLWGKALRMDTVHVADVCAATAHVCKHARSAAMRIFNLADSGATTQGRVNEVLEELFEVKTGFAGTIMSNLAKLNFKQICADANEGHLPVWLGLLRAQGIANSPLSTLISADLLHNNNLAVDGTAITQLGASDGDAFAYRHPQLTTALVREQLEHAIRQGTFPRTRKFKDLPSADAENKPQVS